MSYINFQSHILFYLLATFPTLRPLQKGNCYSTLSSCYRELGKTVQALQACNDALGLFKPNEYEKYKNFISSVQLKKEKLTLPTASLSS
jgi:hypothetical protein